MEVKRSQLLASYRSSVRVPQRRYQLVLGRAARSMGRRRLELGHSMQDRIDGAATQSLAMPSELTRLEQLRMRAGLHRKAMDQLATDVSGDRRGAHWPWQLSHLPNEALKQLLTHLGTGLVVRHHHRLRLRRLLHLRLRRPRRCQRPAECAKRMEQRWQVLVYP